jgi:hypothetical protein
MNADKILLGETEGEGRLSGKHKHRWADIKTEQGVGLWVGFIWLRIGTSG